MNSNLLSLTGKHVILDQIETWPHEILEILTRNEEVISAYINLEQQIDKKAEEDIMLRTNRPQNKYQSEWLQVINQLEDKLKTPMFVGFHCTRLIDLEIQDIMTHGLKPLSRKMLDYRIDKLRLIKMINDKVSEELKNNNLSSDSSREGKIFFFHSTKTLRNESGLYRLFRLWGGEALYANHEKNEEVYNELLGIGKPCIVIGSLNYDDINPYPSLATKFVSIFQNKSNPGNYSYDFDNWVQRAVEVLSVIKRDDELFEKLTGFSAWKMGG